MSTLGSEDKSKQSSIGKYKILSILGRGSMGVVYKAQDPEIGRIVAIKTLRNLLTSSSLSSEALVERFKQEARSAGNLRHPNIITIFEINQDNNTPFIAMDYVDGEGLDVIINRKGKIAPKECIDYLSQIALALDYAHSKGVIHKDLKPSNLLVDSQGRVFILDFGVATVGNEAARSQGNVIMGTPSYMAPEQVRGEDLDWRVDLFSLAILAFEAFTGVRPFEGDNFTIVLANILSDQKLSMTALSPELPLSLEAVFEKALASSREQRFTSASEFVGAICLALSVEIPETIRSKGEFTGKRRKKRLSSGWQSFKDKFQRVIHAEEGVIEEEEDLEPLVPFSPVKNDHTDGSVLNPWKVDDNKIEFLPAKVYGNAFMKDNFSRPSDIFGSEDYTWSVQSERAKLIMGRVSIINWLTILFGVACVVLAVLILVVLWTRPPLPSDGAAVPPIMSAGGVETSSAPPSLPKLASIPDHSNVSAMTDEELVSILVGASNPVNDLVNALREATRRKLSSLVDAAPYILRHDSHIVRVEAIRAYSQLGDASIVNEIVLRLDDHDPIVRFNAANALGELGADKALGYLHAKLALEEVVEVKDAISQAIQKITGIRASKAVIDAP